MAFVIDSLRYQGNEEDILETVNFDDNISQINEINENNPNTFEQETIDFYTKDIIYCLNNGLIIFFNLINAVFLLSFKISITNNCSKYLSIEINFSILMCIILMICSIDEIQSNILKSNYQRRKKRLIMQLIINLVFYVFNFVLIYILHKTIKNDCYEFQIIYSINCIFGIIFFIFFNIIFIILAILGISYFIFKLHVCLYDF